jgi:hypothetical protein
VSLFKVSCHSACGTYFASYLQSVTVIADDPEQAKDRVEGWLKREGRSFLKPRGPAWVVEKLRDSGHVIDWHEDSDY